MLLSILFQFYIASSISSPLCIAETHIFIWLFAFLGYLCAKLLYLSEKFTLFFLHILVIFLKTELSFSWRQFPYFDLLTHIICMHCVHKLKFAYTYTHIYVHSIYIFITNSRHIYVVKYNMGMKCSFSLCVIKMKIYWVCDLVKVW